MAMNETLSLAIAHLDKSMLTHLDKDKVQIRHMLEQ